jgi:uncharacterized protein (TIGR03437 family)
MARSLSYAHAMLRALTSNRHTRCGLSIRFDIAALTALTCLGQPYTAPAPVFTQVFGGTSGSDIATGGAVDTHGNLIAIGTTNSPDFPVVNAFRPALTTLPLVQSPDGKAANPVQLGGAVDVLAMAGSLDGTALYASSSSGIFRSSDGGVTWNQQLPGIGGLTTLAVDAGDPNILYAGITGDPFGGLLYGSEDGGKNWTSLATYNGFFTVKNVQTSAAPSTVYHMENALFRSRDRGNTWVPLAPNKLYIFTYALAPSDAGVVYAVASDGLLYRSADAGDTWTAPGAKFGAAGTLDPQVFSMGVDPVNENVVWMLAGANLYRSTDGGATALVVLSIPQDAPHWVSVSPTSGRVVVGGYSSALASTDGGATWNRFTSGAYFHTVFASRTEFYAGASASTDTFLTKWSEDGRHLVFSTFLGPGSTAVATDSSDNIYVTGLTYGGSPFATGPANPQRQHPFLAKFDPNGNFLFSKPIGGYDIKIDAQGYLYLRSDKGVTQTSRDPCSPNSYNPVVMKLDPQGNVIYSTIVAETCGGNAAGLAVDASGAVYLSGNTSSPNLPTTPTVIQPSPPGQHFYTGFLARLSPNGDRVTYLTYIGGNNSSAYGVAIDASGGVYVTGGTTGFPPPISPTATFTSSANCDSMSRSLAYIMKIDLSMAAPLWLTEIGGGCFQPAAGASLAFDSKGNVFLGGQTFSGEYPPIAPLQAQATDIGFVSELSPDGKQLLFSTYAPGHLVSGTQDDFAIIGIRTPSPHKLNTAATGIYPPYALVEKLNIAATPTSVIDTIGKQEPSSFDYHTLLLGIAPGQMVRITGRGLGPATTAGAQIDASGRVATALAGTRVLFDGVPAPLISVQASEILCMTPFEVGGKNLMSIQIERNSIAAPGVLVGVVPAALELDVLAVANQDASANSSANPAHWGQVVTLYITGAGNTVPSVPDGSIYQPPLPVPPQTSISSFLGKVQYAGPAPGMVAGIWQVNVRLPASNPGGTPNPIRISVGGFGTLGAYGSSATASVWIVP